MARVPGLGWALMAPGEVPELTLPPVSPPRPPWRWTAPMELMEDVAFPREEALRYVIYSMIDQLKRCGADPRVLLDEYRWAAEYDFPTHALVIKGDDHRTIS